MFVTINGADIKSMKDFHDLIAQELRFPDWYGKNLDALYDCLTDISDDTTVTLAHALEWFQTLGKDAITAVRVMQDASQLNPNFHFYFASDDDTYDDYDD